MAHGIARIRPRCVLTGFLLAPAPTRPQPVRRGGRRSVGDGVRSVLVGSRGGQGRRGPHRREPEAGARALETRNLASIIGADELSERDRRFLKFADLFDTRFVGQGEAEDRSIEATLNLAWELMSTFPRDALTRVNETDLAKYYHGTD